MGHIDKQLVKTRFAKSAGSYAEYARAQKDIAARLCSLLSETLPDRPGEVLEIGCGTGTFTRCFLETFRPCRMTLNDICTEMEDALGNLLSPGKGPDTNPPAWTAGTSVRFVPGDAEQCDLPDGQDMIVSTSVIQWFEDPGAFIARCHSLLRDGGYLALTTFGPDNLQEISSITGTGLSYRPLGQLDSLLSENGFRTLLAEEEHITLHFPSPDDVLRHLKKTGVTGISRTVWTRRDLSGFSSRYISLYGMPDGSIPLTYHPIYLIARKR